MNDYKADLLEDLKDVEYAGKYLSAAYADSIEALLVALRDVAEARKGMSNLAREARVNRENLYRMLSEKGNPRARNLKAVLKTLPFDLIFVPKRTEATARPNKPAPMTSSGLAPISVGSAVADAASTVLLPPSASGVITVAEQAPETPIGPQAYNPPDKTTRSFETLAINEVGRHRLQAIDGSETRLSLSTPPFIAGYFNYGQENQSFASA